MSHISRAIRKRVRRRARGLCEYRHTCEEYTGHEFTVDHVVPEARDGSTHLRQLMLVLFLVQQLQASARASEDPRTRHVVALYNPRPTSGTNHFRWSRDSSRILGRTAIGRATIHTLRLNRPSLVLHAGMDSARSAPPSRLAETRGERENLGLFVQVTLPFSTFTPPVFQPGRANIPDPFGAPSLALPLALLLWRSLTPNDCAHLPGPPERATNPENQNGGPVSRRFCSA